MKKQGLGIKPAIWLPFLFGKNLLSPSLEQSKKRFISLLIVTYNKWAQQCIW